MASLTDAIAEAYASVSTGVDYYETVELDHPLWVDPLRLISGYKGGTTINLPPALGDTPVAFTTAGMQITLPSDGPDGPSGMKLIIMAATADIVPHLRLAAEGMDPITVVYRQYVTTQLDRPGEVVDGVDIKEVATDGSSASADMVFEEIETQAFPLPTYDDTYYPALQVQGDDQES